MILKIGLTPAPIPILPGRLGIGLGILKSLGEESVVVAPVEVPLCVLTNVSLEVPVGECAPDNVLVLPVRTLGYVTLVRQQTRKETKTN